MEPIPTPSEFISAVFDIPHDLLFFAAVVLVALLTVRLILWVVVSIFSSLYALIFSLWDWLPLRRRHPLLAVDAGVLAAHLARTTTSMPEMSSISSLLTPGSWTPDRTVVREPRPGEVVQKWYAVIVGRYPGVYCDK